MSRLPLWALLASGFLHLTRTCAGEAAEIGGFDASAHFGEQTRQLTPDDGVRVLLNAPGDFAPDRPTHLVVYALPNGNTIEQTLGCTTTPGMDWHFDIQHVAAQVRLVRKLAADENVVVAAVEADTKSWPAWRKTRPDNPARIRRIVDAVVAAVPGKPVRVTLAGHSGGGSFLFGFIDGGDVLPPNVSRIVWLDANYSYDDAEKRHGDKLLAWLRREDATPPPHLVVIAYDDREITLNGKKVVGDTGGTYRATHRMIHRFKADLSLEHVTAGDFDRYSGLGGRVTFLIHRNPEVKILHTVLVERNGLVDALTRGTAAEGNWGGQFWGPRAYTSLIQPASAFVGPTTAPSTMRAGAPAIPPRPAGALGGKAFAESIDDLPPAAREAAIVREALRGNVPQFLRTLRRVTLKSGSHTCVVKVMPDYLAVGADDDFLRIPMTPASAKAIADAFGFTLPTAKIVDAVYAQADVKLEPRPLTEARETIQTFAQHNAIIEGQRGGKPLGALVAGIKKDVVISNKLKAKPGKVAIYGWHKPDGKPIQPLYAGHAAHYVDYSHGIRLVSRGVTLDGAERDLLDVLADPETCRIVGEEEPILRSAATYDAD
jgi:hypothetical protein